MAKDWFAELLEAHTKDAEADWGEPLSPCPPEVALREYHKALAAGLDEAGMTPEQRRAAAHVYQCKRCYLQIEAMLTADAARRVRTAAALFQGRENDAAFLLSVLSDTARARWIRAMAADHLGNCGGSHAIERLGYFALNDPDSQVREASREACELLKNMVAIAARWLEKTGDIIVAGFRLGLAARQPEFAFANAMYAMFPDAKGITGTSDDGRLRWQLRIEDDVWLRLETDDPDMDNRAISVRISKLEDPEPAFQEEITIRAVGPGRYGASVFVGRAKDIGLGEEHRVTIRFAS